MNNIKFRGFRKDGKGWVEGNLFVPNKLVRGVYICPDTTMADFFPDIDKEDEPIKELPKSDGIALGHFYEVEPNSVGMSVGLSDKNGKEIFGSIPIDGAISKGGDVVKHDDYTNGGCVTFEQYKRISHVIIHSIAKGLKLQGLPNSIIESKHIEIIGNQYQQ